MCLPTLPAQAPSAHHAWTALSPQELLTSGKWGLEKARRFVRRAWRGAWGGGRPRRTLPPTGAQTPQGHPREVTISRAAESKRIFSSMYFLQT